MPIGKGCTHCGSDQHNTTDCPMMVAVPAVPERLGRVLDRLPSMPDDMWRELNAAIDELLVATPAAQPAEEREAFEHIVRFNWASAPLHRVRDALPMTDPRYGEYVDETLRHAWTGFQSGAAWQRAQCALAASPAAEVQQPMVSVTQQDANNYCLILSALGMEEEGDPVGEVQRLMAQEAERQEPVSRACRGCVACEGVPSGSNNPCQVCGGTVPAERQEPAPDADPIALDAATAIMALMYGPTPAGGSVQLKAQVQCRVLDAIKAAPRPAVAGSAEGS